MMYCATLATTNGSVATITRSTNPHSTAAGPESHRILSTGGMFLSARTRSRQGLSPLVVVAGWLIKVWNVAVACRIGCTTSAVPCLPSLDIPAAKRSSINLSRTRQYFRSYTSKMC